jgi:hypothetical protein
VQWIAEQAHRYSKWDENGEVEQYGDGAAYQVVEDFADDLPPMPGDAYQIDHRDFLVCVAIANKLR